MRLYMCMCVCFAALLFCGCEPKQETTARSGVQIANVTVPVGSDGLTSEQRNIRQRLQSDNKPGAIKHLYVFSAYSGQCLLYSTVKEKVTSSGKRLSPNTKAETWNDKIYTNEALQDDGTYGSSIEYLYWFDTKGIYHQHYFSGGTIVHISTEPMPVKSVIINLETK